MDRFRNIMATHGLAGGAAVFAAYKAWCAQNPTSRICGSAKSIESFAGMLEATHGPREPRRSAAAAASANLVSAPASLGTQNLRITHRMSCRGDKLVVEGTDLLTALTSASVVTPGTRIYEFLMSLDATDLVNTRLQSLARLFEKYDIESLEFHYQPAVSTSTAGSIVIAFDNDPSDSAPSQDTNGLRALYSYRSNTTTSTWVPAVLRCQLDKSTLSLFTSSGDDPRLSSPGRLVVAVSAGVPVTTTLGNLWVKYRVALSSPSELPTSSDVLCCAARNTAAATTLSWMDVCSAGRTAFAENAPALATITNNASGNIVVKLAAGRYLFEEYIPGISAASTLNALTVQSVQGVGTTTLVTANIQVLVGAAANYSLYRKTLITVPDGNSVYISSTLTVSITPAASRFMVRDASLVPVGITAALLDAY